MSERSALGSYLTADSAICFSSASSRSDLQRAWLRSRSELRTSSRPAPLGVAESFKSPRVCQFRHPGLFPASRSEAYLFDSEAVQKKPGTGGFSLTRGTIANRDVRSV